MWDGPGKSKEDWTRQPIFKLYLHSFNFLNLHATSGKRRGSVDAWNCSKLNRVFSELFCLALLAPGTYAMLMPMSAFSGEARNLGQNLQDAEPRNVICQQWYLCANIPEISIHSPALSCRSVDLAASMHGSMDFPVCPWTFLVLCHLETEHTFPNGSTLNTLDLLEYAMWPASPPGSPPWHSSTLSWVISSSPVLFQPLCNALQR